MENKESRQTRQVLGGGRGGLSDGFILCSMHCFPPSLAGGADARQACKYRRGHLNDVAAWAPKVYADFLTGLCTIDLPHPPPPTLFYYYCYDYYYYCYSNDNYSDYVCGC